jgi:hypothetical protein
LRSRSELGWLAVAAALLGASAPAGALTVGALGDSLTDEYAQYLAQYLTPMPQLSPTNPQPSGPDPMNWVEQLASDRAAELDFGALGAWLAPRNQGYAHNWARAGATTTTLLNEGGGQHAGAASQGLDLVYVGIGSNNFAPIDYAPLGLVDVFGGIYNGCQSLASCSTPFTGSNGLVYSSIEDYAVDLVAELATAVLAIQASGADIVLGTIADWGDLPASLATYPIASPGAYTDPGARQLVSDAVEYANVLLLQLAAANGIPVVDVHALLAAGDGSLPLALGGIAIQAGAPGGTRDPTSFFLPDGAHADTLVQGIFANAIIAAANAAYGTDLTPLGDAEILANAGLVPANGWDGFDFDASVFVVPEPPAALLVFATLALLGLHARRRPA